MSKELTDEMCVKYPLVTRLYLSKKSNAPFAYYGIECGDGWRAVLEPLFAAMESTAAGMQQAGTAKSRLPALAQVKEKFGTLRIYLDNGTTEIREAINAAEAQSQLVCENCGAPGVLRTQGWLATLCDVHANPKKAA